MSYTETNKFRPFRGRRLTSWTGVIQDRYIIGTGC
jgi:hypothetical protein